MKLKIFVATLAVAGSSFFPQSVFSADHVVEMLDRDGDAVMVFKPAYLKVSPGDTVTFKPTHKTHYVKAMTAPAGASKFSSKEDETFTVTLDKAGIYFYVCPPHMVMAMVGAIQVGDGDAVKAEVPSAIKAVLNMRDRMMTNADRADQLVKKFEMVK